MSDQYYEKKHYDMTMTENPDSLTVRKSSGSEWCQIRMDTNREPNGMITIRSQAMAESLHFMLGQLLAD